MTNPFFGQVDLSRLDHTAGRRELAYLCSAKIDGDGAGIGGCRDGLVG